MRPADSARWPAVGSGRVPGHNPRRDRHPAHPPDRAGLGRAVHRAVRGPGRARRRWLASTPRRRPRPRRRAVPADLPPRVVAARRAGGRDRHPTELRPAGRGARGARARRQGLPPRRHLDRPGPRAGPCHLLRRQARARAPASVLGAPDRHSPGLLVPVGARDRDRCSRRGHGRARHHADPTPRPAPVALGGGRGRGGAGRPRPGLPRRALPLRRARPASCSGPRSPLVVAARLRPATALDRPGRRPAARGDPADANRKVAAILNPIKVDDPAGFRPMVEKMALESGWRSGDLVGDHRRGHRLPRWPTRRPSPAPTW